VALAQEPGVQGVEVLGPELRERHVAQRGQQHPVQDASCLDHRVDREMSSRMGQPCLAQLPERGARSMSGTSLGGRDHLA
jgi:hypothetical protein